MKNKFSPSVNIERDFGKSIHYIPTPNAENVVKQIDQDSQKGIRSFSIIGSYGSGKSSFLWAFQDQLLNHNKHFKSTISLNGKNNYELVNIVGMYSPIEEALQKRTNKKNDFLEIVKSLYKKAEKRNNGLLIIIDEFGKHLEYASKHNPEKELYRVQQLAEFVNSSDRNILFIISLHQGFDTYSRELSYSQRYEWEKVRGRLKEITFNEPVQQLLFLASEHLSNNKNVPENFNILNKAISASHLFSFKSKLSFRQIKKLYPLDELSASLITLALQRYGQNERSLFTFLNSSDPSGLDSFEHKSDYYSVSNCYDYLINNFHSYLASRYNPDFLSWQLLKSTLQRAETLFDHDFEDISKMIKTIGLLNTFTSNGAKVNEKFLLVYGKHALGLKNVKGILESLVDHKLIRYLNYRDSYFLFEGTDIDIDKKLIEAESKIVFNVNVSALVEEHINLPVLLAKGAFFKYGIPRFFKFEISDEPISLKPKNEIDGYINLIFNDVISYKELLTISQNCNDAILYGRITNLERIRSNLFEIEKAKEVLKEIENDSVAKRECSKIISYHEKELFDILTESLFESKSNVDWFFKGSRLKITDRYQFNKTLSQICEDVYPSCPYFDSELINRNKLPGGISSARRRLLEKIETSYSEFDLGFDKKYPPEKTIYLSLLKKTGMHRKVEGVLELTKPTEESFYPLWNVCEKFFESSKVSRRNLQDLFDILFERPFKLKRGFIDFWIPIWLLIKRNDFALYKEEQFLPEFGNDTFDVILKNPSNYFIKAFDLGGIKLDLFNKYRKITNQEEEKSPTKKSFIETIKPFLVFYKDLPNYTQNTNRLTKEAINLRRAIERAKDPEQTFFQDFPNALGFTSNELSKSHKTLEKFIKELHSKIDELRSCYSQLLNRIETALVKEFDFDNTTFPEYKFEMQRSYSHVKEYLLKPEQKIIYQRINSGIDDRDSWLSSLYQPILKKKLEQLDDKDEKLVYEKTEHLKFEFDNLLEFSNLNLNDKKRTALKFSFASTDGDQLQQTIQISNSEEKLANNLADKLRENFMKNKKQNIVALVKLLKEELNDK
jgi:hypothetical protein